MGLRDFLNRFRPSPERRPGREGQDPQPGPRHDRRAQRDRAPLDPAAADLRAQWEPFIRGALDESEGGAEATTTDPRAAELLARARELQSEILTATTWENTPAWFAGDDDAPEDATVADVRGGPSSKDLEDDLGLLYLSDPAAFRGTEFEYLHAHEAEMRAELLGDGQAAAAQHSEPSPEGAEAAGDWTPQRARAALDVANDIRARLGLETMSAPADATLDQLDDLLDRSRNEVEEVQRQREDEESEDHIDALAASITPDRAGEILDRAEQDALHSTCCRLPIERCPTCSALEHRSFDEFTADRELTAGAWRAVYEHGWNATQLREHAAREREERENDRDRDEEEL